ncbi:S24 family peptidase [Treponema sp. JC4]|uniref:S24 family peptidase n=1 Tax=Treponema sp. JC4 TaxID=1124982 RepID=UPI00030DE217|nr:S24 family peptidase [Treponema sp. JC4]
MSGGYVKRLMKILTGIRVISDNPVYPAFEVSKNSEYLQIIGKVRYVRHKIQG